MKEQIFIPIIIRRTSVKSNSYAQVYIKTIDTVSKRRIVGVSLSNGRATSENLKLKQARQGK